MLSYADAELPTLFPGIAATPAEVRNVLSEVRKSPMAKGVFGPLIVHHADVTELLRDKRLRGPGMDFALLAGIPEGSRAWKRMAQILLFMEGEDHVRLRRLVSKAFTPRSVDALRPFVRATISRLVDDIVEAKSADAVSALCDPFPIPVICALIGIESDRWEDMSRWATSILLTVRLDAGTHLAEIEAAQVELDEFISELIAERRVDARDDLLSHLIAAEEEGERLSTEELLSVVAMMIVAGTDTTRNQLSNMIHTFAENPDAWALLREKPELVHAAMEEAIRWEPATEAIPRLSLEDLEIGGIHIPAGSLVVLMSMSANHDTAAMPGADRFDIERDLPSGWHLLTFGGGMHYCLGANLARVELGVMLDELLRRLPDMERAGPMERLRSNLLAGIKHLPVRFTPQRVAA